VWLQLFAGFARLGEIEAGDWKLALLSMGFQLESVFEKGLHHGAQVVLGWLGGVGPGVDVELIREYPAGQTTQQAAMEFADVDLVGKDEEGEEGLIRRCEDSSSGDVHISAIEGEG